MRKAFRCAISPVTAVLALMVFTQTAAKGCENAFENGARVVVTPMTDPKVLPGLVSFLRERPYSGPGTVAGKDGECEYIVQPDDLKRLTVTVPAAWLIPAPP